MLPKALTILALVGTLIAPLALSGCGDDTQNSVAQAQAGAQAEMAANQAQLAHDPLALKQKSFLGPAYDADRVALRRHIEQHPDVASTAIESGGDYDTGITVILRPSVSRAAARSFAHRLRGYMAAHYSSDRSLIVNEIEIHYAAGSSTDMGMVAAYVETGVADTDTTHDSTWHVIIDKKQVE